MKKAIYVLILPLVVVSGIVFANRQIKNESSEQLTPKPPTAAEKNAAMKEWQATPAGIKFKAWEVSPEGEKVLAGAAKIKKHINSGSSMEAVVTALTLPPGARLGFGLMVRIDGEEYILSFGPENFAEHLPLHNLKVDDKIMIRSRNVSYAPKYNYPILSGDYVERNNKIIYKRAPGKDGC